MDTALKNIRKSLRRLIQSYGVFSDETWRDFGINYSQSQILFEIEESPGISAKELAALLRSDKSTISRLLKKLKLQKTVEYKITTDDGRLKGIYLTSAGRRLVKRLNNLANEKTREALAGLSKKDIQAVERALDVFNR